MTTELQVLREYIKSEFGYEVTPDVDLLDAHILDSFSIVRLAMFVEERFAIDLEAEDLVRTNLSTLASIVSLIEKKGSSPI